MFQKINHNVIQQSFNNLKKGIHNGYHHVKNIAGHIDNSIHVAKHIYRAIEPAIKELLPQQQRHIHEHAVKALNGYEQIRNKALDINAHASNVGHKLNGLI
jgi:hypothetical protein